MQYFPAKLPEVYMQRAAEYEPVSSVTAEIIADYLDEIINSSEHNRSAVSKSDYFSEWFESSVLLADRTPDSMILWPLKSQKLLLRRIEDRDDTFGGNTYIMMLQHESHRDDLEDPIAAKSCVLSLPPNPEIDSPTMMLCHHQSFLRNGLSLTDEVSAGTIYSSYHEVDDFLESEFYQWYQATEYDAEKFFDELTVFYEALMLAGTRQ